MPSPTPLLGGCLCGTVRYRLDRVKSAYWCHCTLCRRASGANALPWATVARGDFHLTAGVLKTHASSPGVARGFCAACGSPILFDMAAEDAVDVTLGTLDEPDRLRPSHHIWTSTALAMSEGLGAHLPRFAAERTGDEAEPPPTRT
ncbi:GFA family protein [Xanthobacter sp. V4C-4]|uniref:GFA family protein n=1 Tax=Xanthobacter cornucopiae TaxID=3119924 RepID=UPI00372B9281